MVSSLCHLQYAYFVHARMRPKFAHNLRNACTKSPGANCSSESSHRTSTAALMVWCLDVTALATKTERYGGIDFQHIRTENRAFIWIVETQLISTKLLTVRWLPKAIMPMREKKNNTEIFISTCQRRHISEQIMEKARRKTAPILIWPLPIRRMSFPLNTIQKRPYLWSS